MTRRNFINAGLLTGAGTVFGQKKWSANDRIGVGLIGCGIMGRHHLKHLLQGKDDWGVEIIAACDIYDMLRDHAVDLALASGEYIGAYRDFRDLFSRKDIDAVFIATPDHWHAMMTVEACKAGKDIYIQKPISIDTRESRLMVNAVRKYNRVCQVGTQQPSWNNFSDAIKIVQSGILGKIVQVKTFMYGLDIFPGPFDALNSRPPQGLDWDMWLGPASLPPFGPSNNFNKNIFGAEFGVEDTELSGYKDTVKLGNRIMTQTGTWRLFKPAGGLQTDWGVHLTDIVLRAMQTNGPISVSSHGKNLIYKDNRQVPNQQITVWEFPEFNCLFDLISGNSFTYERLPQSFDKSHGIIFLGSEGTLFVNRSGYNIEPLPGKKIDIPEIDGRILPLQQKYDGHGDDTHVANFFESVRSRQDPIAPIEGGRYATDMCIAANAAHLTGKRLEWDPESGTTTESLALPYLNLEYRSPWKLEV